MNKLLISLSFASLMALGACTSAPTGFMDVFETYNDYPADLSFDASSEGFSEMGDVAVDNCLPEADGVCGYNLFIYGPEAYSSGDSEFYFMTTAGGPGEFFGPFNGDLEMILDEAAAVEGLTDL